MADSEDLTAQVFSEAFESLERYQERGSFAAWLFTIAHRRVIDYYRRQRPQITLDEALSPFIDSTGPLDQVMRTESLHQLLRLVAQLDDDKQELHAAPLRSRPHLQRDGIGHWSKRGRGQNGVGVDCYAG